MFKCKVAIDNKPVWLLPFGSDDVSPSPLLAAFWPEKGKLLNAGLVYWLVACSSFYLRLGQLAFRHPATFASLCDKLHQDPHIQLDSCTAALQRLLINVPHGERTAKTPRIRGPDTGQSRPWLLALRCACPFPSTASSCGHGFHFRLQFQALHPTCVGRYKY